MTLIFTAICLLFALACVQTARIAYIKKQPDMYWLAANFGAAALGNLFSIVILLPIPGIILMIVTSLCMVMFVQRTFYRDRKSPYLFVLGLLVVLGIWQVYSTITNPISFISMTQLGFAVVWLWQAFLAINTYRAINRDRTLEDWVKARYLLWFAYTSVMFVISARMLLSIPYASFESFITTPLLILSVIVQYTTWTMPEPIRQWLNRNYKPVAAPSAGDLMKMSEEELLHQLQP
jgi:hypothetical protein